MNKKGFTLVELLGVIVIIAAILSIILPGVNSVLRKSKNTIMDVQLSKILNAAYDYSLKNLNILPDKGTIYITLNELKNKGFVDSDIKNAKTEELFNDDLVISIRKVATSYNNKEENSIRNGNYLYKIEEETNISNKPIFTFEGYEEVPTLINVNLGDIYEELSYTAQTSKGVDITNKVVKNIIYNSSNIDKVSTNNAGIYYINYCVVDDNGDSGCAKVSVVVIDNEVPSLTIPEAVTIQASTTTYNLMNGVSCIDNSGKCDIEIEGKINYGVVGDYIIEYIAKDPSGNTETKKRVIHIK